MRKTTIVLLSLLVVNISYCQSRISIDSVAQHIGDSVTVCAKVHGVKTTSNITFMNMGAAYPHAPLTVLIFTKDIANFKIAPYDLYNDKKVCVTGRLIDYKGKPEIVITGPAQVELDK